MKWQCNSMIIFTILMIISLICTNGCGGNAPSGTAQDVSKSQSITGDPDSTWPQFSRTCGHARQSVLPANGLLDTEFTSVIFNFTGGVSGEPTADLSGHVFIVDNDGKLHCINSQNGNYIWTHRGSYLGSPADAAYCTAAVDLSADPRTGLDRNRVYYTSAGMAFATGVPWVKLWCIDINTGTEIGSWVIGSYLDDSSPAVDGDGNVYVGAVDYNSGWESYLLFIDSTLPAVPTKSEVFTGGQHASNPAVAADGTVYIAYTSWNYENTVLRYNPVSGQQDYPPTGSSGVLSTYSFGQGSPVIGQNGYIYYCMMPALYKLHPRSMSVLATEYPTFMFSDRCTPVLDGNDSVYVGEYMSNNSVRITRFDQDLNRVNVNLNPVEWYSETTTDSYISSPSMTSDGHLFATFSSCLVQLDTNYMIPGGMIMNDIYTGGAYNSSSPSIITRTGLPSVITCTSSGVYVCNTL